MTARRRTGPDLDAITLQLDAVGARQSPDFLAYVATLPGGDPYPDLPTGQQHDDAGARRLARAFLDWPGRHAWSQQWKTRTHL